MALEILFNEPFTEWGWKIAVYVAFIGIAGGAYLTGFIGDVLSRNRESRTHGRVAKYGYFTGLAFIGLGGPILLSHLATPFRAALIPLTMTNLSSWMAIGSYMIILFGLGAFLMFIWTAFGANRPNARTLADGGDEDVATDGGDVTPDGGSPGPADTATPGDQTGGIRGILGKVGILGLLDNVADKTRPSETVRLVVGAVFGIFAAGTLLYSAMALGSGMTNRVPLWDKTLLIPVQIFSGLAAGLFVAVGLAALEERSPGKTLSKYSLAAAGLMTVSLLAVIATIVLLPDMASEGMAVGDTVATASEAVSNLLGTYAWLFIGLAVVGGMVLPILLSLIAAFASLSASAAKGTYALSALLVIVGKLALAMSYLLAAEFVPLPLPA